MSTHFRVNKSNTLPLRGSIDYDDTNILFHIIPVYLFKRKCANQLVPVQKSRDVLCSRTIHLLPPLILPVVTYFLLLEPEKWHEAGASHHSASAASLHPIVVYSRLSHLSYLWRMFLWIT